MTRGALARRVGALVAIAAVLAVALLQLPPIPQDPAYHDLADQRACLGVPSCLNVLSNLPFVVVGLLGLRRLARGQATFLTSAERRPYRVLFGGVALTGLGSAYYHWAPSNATLFWDRLPMTIAFMALLAAVVGERVSLAAGRRLLYPLLGVGVLSTLYWHVGEARGAGDLRPYALVQFGSLLAIPLMLWLFPARYTHTLDLVAAIGWYGLAKVLEHLDRPLFELTGISGHTLKHLASAAAAWWIVRMLARRRPLAPLDRRPGGPATAPDSVA